MKERFRNAGALLSPIADQVLANVLLVRRVPAVERFLKARRKHFHRQTVESKTVQFREPVRQKRLNFCLCMVIPDQQNVCIADSLGQVNRFSLDGRQSETARALCSVCMRKNHSARQDQDAYDQFFHVNKNGVPNKMLRTPSFREALSQRLVYL